MNPTCCAFLLYHLDKCSDYDIISTWVLLYSHRGVLECYWVHKGRCKCHFSGALFSAGPRFYVRFAPFFLELYLALATALLRVVAKMVKSSKLKRGFDGCLEQYLSFG